MSKEVSKQENSKKEHSVYNYDHKVDTCACGNCYKGRVDSKEKELDTCDECGILITGTSWIRPCGKTCYPCGKHHDFHTCPECKDSK